MDGYPHSIRSLRLSIGSADEDTAVSLRTRIADLLHARLLPAMEALFDARAPGGRRIRIDRIALDLGTLPEEGLEEAAVAALTLRLGEALDRALGPHPMPGGPRVLEDAPGEGAPLAVAEHYLLHGTFPYWVARDLAPEPPALLAGLMAGDAAGFVALVRRLGGRRPVIERLVVQGGDTLLRRLLEGLDPANAALIMAYLLDLEGIHRVEPILALSGPAFARLVRVLALSYVVRDAGTQFNRRSFVRSLIEGMAVEEGLTFAEVLESLTRGLELTARILPLNGSLPAVIRELLAERPSGTEEDAGRATADTVAEMADAVERLWAGGGDGDVPPDGALRRLGALDPQALATLVRRHGRREGVVERLVVALDEAALQRLLHHLDPPDAALIIAYVLDLEELHGARPVVALGAEPFARVLRVLVFSYVLRDAGTQFNRRSFVRTLLEGIAARHGLDLGRVVAALCEGLALTERRRPLSSSLPAVLRDIAADLARPEPETGAASGAAGTERETAVIALPPSLVAGLPPEERQPALAAVAASPARTRAMARALAGPEAPVVLALFDALVAMPAALRRGAPDSIRAAGLEELVRWRGGDPARLMETLLRRLYGQPLPDPVVEALVAVADRWGMVGIAPPSAVTALRRALAAAAGRDDGLPPLPHPVAGPSEALAALDAFLLGSPITEAVLDALPDLIDRGDPAVLERLRQAVATAASRARLVAALPEALLARVVRVVEPRGFATLVTAAELLAEAWGEAAPAARPGPGDRGGFWRFLLDFVASPTTERTVERLAPAFFAHTAAVARAAGTGEVERVGMLERLRQAAQRRAAVTGQAALAAAVANGAGSSVAGSGRAGRRAPDLPSRRPDRPSLRQRTAFGLGDAQRPATEPLLIDNAGLVLTGPFLPHLFAQLGLMVPDGGRRMRPRDAEAAGRAVHLLQYLATGRTDTPEPRLALNKLLCGLPPEVPVPPAIDADPAETALCDHLLRAMIGRWEIISNTSVAGLREYFLQREGRLERVGEGWMVTVQRRTVDVLVDQVPWTTSVILNPWQTEPVHVRW